MTSKAEKTDRRAIKAAIREMASDSRATAATQAEVSGFLRTALFVLGDKLSSHFDVHSEPGKNGSGIIMKTTFVHGPEIKISRKGHVKVNGKRQENPVAAFEAAANRIVESISKDSPTVASIKINPYEP